MSWDCDYCGKGRYADHAMCGINQSIECMESELADIKEQLQRITELLEGRK